MSVLGDNKPKRPRDVNQLAATVVRVATDGDAEDFGEKNPAAVLLGRRGGKKGGRARAEKLTPEERREAARKAAMARWGKGDDSDGA